MVNLHWFDYQIDLKQEKTMFLFHVDIHIEGFLGSNYLKIHICNSVSSRALAEVELILQQSV